MMMVRRLGILFLSLISVSAHAQKKQVRTGNQLYQEKKYKDAAAAYQQALARNPTFTPGMFNLGNALYQQKNFDASRKVLAATEKQAKDKNVKANADYNIGNTYMSEQKWEEAVNAYKGALRNNSQDEAAKYNLSYALAMMKKNQGGKNNKQDNKNQQNKDQNKDNKNQDKDKQDKQDENKNQQSEQQQNKEEKKEQQDQRPQPQPSKLSKEQAEQLLNALAQEEKKLHDKKEKGKAVKLKVDKDW